MSEVFSKFRDWKSMVERSTDWKLKVLRNDNGSEYMSGEFGKVDVGRKQPNP